MGSACVMLFPPHLVRHFRPRIPIYLRLSHRHIHPQKAAVVDCVIVMLGAPIAPMRCRSRSIWSVTSTITKRCEDQDQDGGTFIDH